MANMFINLFNVIIKSLASIAGYVMLLLPQSPFGDVSTTPIAGFMGFFNWIIPIGSMITLLGTWVVAITTFYLIGIILRWIKAVKG